MSYPSLTITFLGTGTSSGVPMLGCNCTVCKSKNIKDSRLRSSILVESANTTFVIDTTPDFRIQMLRESVKKLDAVLFTHPHKDHIGGLDDTRPFQFLQKKPTLIYGNASSLEGVIREVPYAFSNSKYPGVPSFELIEIENDKFYIGDIPIIPINVWHLNMPVQGFRLGSFTYITDANKIEEHELEKIKGSNYLVLNALRKEKHISHYNLQEATELAQFLQVPETYFTHISHQLGLHEEINAELPPNIQLAYDGLKINI